MKGKTKFRATDTNSNRLAAVGKTELDGEGLCQLIGADGPLGNDETPQLPGLGVSEMAAFNVLAFENSAEAGSVKKKKKKKVAAIKNGSITVANSETPPSRAQMRMTAYLETAGVCDKYSVIMRVHQLSDTLPGQLDTYSANLRKCFTKISSLVHSENAEEAEAEEKFERAYKMIASDTKWWENVQESCKAMCKPFLQKVNVKKTVVGTAPVQAQTEAQDATKAAAGTATGYA